MHPKIRRTGATAVEMGVSLPILFLFLFASIEFTRAHMIRHTVEMASYEAARIGTIPGATAAECEQRAKRMMQAVFSIDNTITVQPAVLDELANQVTVTTSTPYNSNAWGMSNFMSGKTLQASISKRRETSSDVAMTTPTATLPAPPPPPPPPPPPGPPEPEPEPDPDPSPPPPSCPPPPPPPPPTDI